jgi:Zn-dependent metalloprotease
VHINSGIPNRAFCLTALSLGGFAWERAGRVWYETLRDPRLKPNASFLGFARLTVTVAARLYGADSDVEKAVSDAWGQVGIRVTREKASVPAWGPGAQLPATKAERRPPSH